MATGKYYILMQAALISVLCILSANSEKTAVNCTAPIKFYEELKCTPSKIENDCPVAYNCDHLKSREPTKCYINNNVYNIGEVIKSEDANACEKNCLCVKFDDWPVAEFLCSYSMCNEVKRGCYIRRSPHDTDCCGSEQVCPENPDDRPTCKIGDTTYLDGENFQSLTNPELNCVCMPGYNGEDVEPFCAMPHHSNCIPVLTGVKNLHEKCAPIFFPDDEDNFSTTCPFIYRCPQEDDVVVPATSYDESDDRVCHYGNKTLKIGDQIASQESWFKDTCVCKYPPFLTCSRAYTMGSVDKTNIVPVLAGNHTQIPANA